MERFNDQHVVVTGGASGFGAAIARKFSSEGASVVVADLDLEGAQTLADELPDAIAVQVDVADEAANKLMIERAIQAFGPIHVFCANAGVPHLVSRMIDMDVETFDRQFAINTRSVFLGAKYAVPHMQKGGVFISTSSIGAIRPRPMLTPYYASKGAVVTMTRGLAVELAPDIRVNCVLPVSSPTGFDMNATGSAQLSNEANASVISGIPMGRRAEPEDVANAYAFLASSEAEFLTGVCLDVDGGRSIQ